MLWEVAIEPVESNNDREAQRVLDESHILGTDSIREVNSRRLFLIEGPESSDDADQAARQLLVDTVAEKYAIRSLADSATQNGANNGQSSIVNVLFKPGVTDNVGRSAQMALSQLGIDASAVATGREYQINADANQADIDRLVTRVLANDAIEQVIHGPLKLETLSVGRDYKFELLTIPIRSMDDEQLTQLSREGQLYLSLVEMQTIQKHFVELDRDPTDIELESVAQTWSEHCSHKTLAGRIHYVGPDGEKQFDNMLKETIFAATTTIRQQQGDDDWCLSVFEDNAGIVKFDDEQAVCFKVETHNHPSALEPYGGANTGLGGVIRDPLGTGLGAKPVCNSDVFCFAPPDTPYDSLPPGVLHPKAVAKGVVSGVRDYGNRMGIPTVNGAVLFDERYLGNPLVYCGNVAMIPNDKCFGNMQPGDYIVSVGGKTGRDGIHGATFSSAELTEDSEMLSGGAVQIGNAITEKMVADVILEARDLDLYSAITDCGAGGFSSAVGEMGEKTGAEVWLDRAPLKYEGLTYTEIWISEAQERMVLAVPPEKWDQFEKLCAAESVEATVIGKFTDTGNLVLKYDDNVVGELAMSFLHDGRPPVIREARFDALNIPPATIPKSSRYDDDLKAILGSLNVCSKEWIIRQYDHEVQSGSVVKPLVGIEHDGPSDAAVVRPDLKSNRGLAISCGINPRFGDIDPYWMAASVIDEAVRNCVAVGADPAQIAILDNFCWGNTDRPEVLGSLVRAALGCQDVAIAFQTPFISGKDSLYNEFAYVDADGNKQSVAIPSSLLISALGQLDDISQAVTMDLKEVDNRLYLIGETHDELGGSHWLLVNEENGGSNLQGEVPRVDLERAPKIFAALHSAIKAGTVRSCHDLSEGGLAVSIAEMAFAGGWGANLELDELLQQSSVDDAGTLLFSESNTRFLVEVPLESAAEFEKRFAGLPLAAVGEVVSEGELTVRCGGETVIQSSIADLKSAWQKPLDWD